MTESHNSESEAASLYVLDELEPAERRAFEARLEQSAGLRALVRDIEAGTVALTVTAPRREPPEEVWRNIENAIAQEMDQKTVAPSRYSAWLRNGWGAAAACLLGWLLYALWVHRGAPLNGVPSFVSVNPSAAETSSVDLSRDKPARFSRTPVVAGNVVPPSAEMLQARGQIGGLRRHVAELESRVAHLSQVVTQQQAWISQPGHLTFFHLFPANATGSAGLKSPPPSPELQRALLLALARELGWLRPLPDGEQKPERPGLKDIDPMLADQLGVDFVDLPPASQDPDHAVPLPPDFDNQTTSPGLLARAPGGAIPGYVSGTNWVFAVDPSIVGSGNNHLTVLGGASHGGLQVLGSVGLNNNPTVITVPFTTTAADGWVIGVTAGNFSFGPTRVGGEPPIQSRGSP